MPEIATDVADELGIMDYIFICVKNYSLEQVCKQIAPMVGEKTVVVPIMNGTNPGERTRKYLGKGIVLDSLIYIVSGSEEDFTVVQKGDYASIHIG
jgi:2-dehydropantoate 2-reductase